MPPIALRWGRPSWTCVAWEGGPPPRWKAFARTKSARVVRALAEKYHKLPHEVLQATPLEFYVDMLLSPDIIKWDEVPPRAPREGPTLLEQLQRLNWTPPHG